MLIIRQLKSWLNEAKNFEWTDYSVPLTKPLDVNEKRIEENFATEYHYVVV